MLMWAVISACERGSRSWCWCRNTSCKPKVLILQQSCKLFIFSKQRQHLLITMLLTMPAWSICQNQKIWCFIETNFVKFVFQKIFMVIYVYFRMLIDWVFLKRSCTIIGRRDWVVSTWPEASGLIIAHSSSDWPVAHQFPFLSCPDKICIVCMKAGSELKTVILFMYY